jgi:hypothetical protein
MWKEDSITDAKTMDFDLPSGWLYPEVLLASAVMP